MNTQVELLQSFYSRAPSASITESVVSVSHRILVCLVVADVVFSPRIFLCVPEIAALSKDGPKKRSESECQPELC